MSVIITGKERCSVPFERPGGSMSSFSNAMAHLRSRRDAVATVQKAGSAVEARPAPVAAAAKAVAAAPPKFRPPARRGGLAVDAEQDAPAELAPSASASASLSVGRLARIRAIHPHAPENPPPYGSSYFDFVTWAGRGELTDEEPVTAAMAIDCWMGRFDGGPCGAGR